MDSSLFDSAIRSYLTTASENYSLLNSEFEQPRMLDERVGFRHSYYSAELCVLLKAGKLISNNWGIQTLAQHRMPQEAFSLVRISDDMVSEIVFALTEEGAPLFKFLKAFFEEEFSNFEKPLSGPRKRATTSKRKLHASYSRLASEVMNPSDAALIVDSVSTAFSGYIHGAYPHLMEMYGGKPSQYHLHKLPASEYTESVNFQLSTYVYQSFVVLSLLAQKIGQIEHASILKSISERCLDEFELGKPSRTISEMKT